MAESEGFEPSGPFGPTVFKTVAIDHSANSPRESLGKVIKKSNIVREKRLTILNFLSIMYLLKSNYS